MRSSVKNDIRSVLDKAHSAVRKKNYHLLDGLSNRLNHAIAIYQDKEVSLCAVAIFALGKIFTNDRYFTDSGFQEFRNDVLSNLKAASKAMKADNLARYARHLRVIEIAIKRIDDRLKLYQTPLLTHARAKKSSHAIEHGLSASQANALFNAPKWGTSKQLGKSAAHEKHHALPKFNQQRIELVKRLFGIK